MTRPARDPRSRWLPGSVPAALALVIACTTTRQPPPGPERPRTGVAADVDADVGAGPAAAACTGNRDCDDSPEARSLRGLRCPSESYCLGGQCRAACSKPCPIVPPGENPCAGGALCDPLLALCRFRPLACTAATDCPRFLPPLPGGGLGQWTCTGGHCAYPGFTFPTRD
jgi:hypothetical protein